MDHIEWDDKYCIGHKRIDLEHQVFVDLLATASELNDEQSKETVIRFLTEIKKYADFHFYSEENMMLEIQYPEYEKHKNEHQILLSGLEKNFKEYKNGETSLAQLVNYLFGWFVIHTSTADRKIAEFYKEILNGS